MMHYLPFIWFGSMLSLVIFDIINAPAFVVIGVVSFFIGMMIYCDDEVMQRDYNLQTRGDKQ